MGVYMQTNGGLTASNDSDAIIGTAQNTGQMHIYAKAGDDYLALVFENGISNGGDNLPKGHHARGDADGSNDRGSDTFDFQNTDSVKNGTVVVGRLEDFDSRDRIFLEMNEIDLHDLPGNVRIVEFNGGHNDPGALPQQWILIETSGGGHIFYALEGARVDMDGNGGSAGDYENHFILDYQLPDFSTLPDVDYVDPQNYVPDGYAPDGGIIINDDDNKASHVLKTIEGTSGGDLIAAGLNDDRVEAGGGDDTIWGGTGHDTLRGGAGTDELTGGRGADVFVFKTGDMIDVDEVSGTWADKVASLDVITDFMIGEDKIDLSGFAGVNSMSDIGAAYKSIDGNQYFQLIVKDTNERVLVDVDDGTAWSEFHDPGNFLIA